VRRGVFLEVVSPWPVRNLGQFLRRPLGDSAWNSSRGYKKKHVASRIMLAVLKVSARTLLRAKWPDLRSAARRLAPDFIPTWKILNMASLESTALVQWLVGDHVRRTS
jgi:hypothetical protein